MLKGITWTNLTLYDTQTLPEYARLTSPDRPGLKFLTRMELGDEIQEGSDGHCSVEDARATMKLYLLQESSFARDQSTLFTRSGAPVIAIKPPCPRYAPGDRVALPMIAEFAAYGRKFNYRTSTWDYECEDPNYWLNREPAPSQPWTPPSYWSENTDWDAPRPTSPW
ncbi:hypothetical protein D0867_14888 [Hortaea werneckii]|uniref:Exonuclease domain-containing protein n=1 Tax=Hortaea werneckii TaxID=91943 RepID=A0A3M7AF50_HORWE|nr:hypothetical protein D0867_14888 [Hortaea werneckii]RMY26204.1 hypothetical protein D0866_10914 [Hortaea werneckii]